MVSTMANALVIGSLVEIARTRVEQTTAETEAPLDLSQ
jgi:hypothetical protein